LAASNLSPALSPFFSAFLDSQVELIDRILAPKLHCCEFEDEFGCGELGVVTEIESEREYCPRHFRQVSLWRAVEALEVAR
jgi:hypothetical protein